MSTQRLLTRDLPTILTLLLLAGCGRSEDELRSLMRKEIASTFLKSHITSTQVIGPYSPAVRSGPFLFVSGQIGIDPNTLDLVSDGLEAQTRQALMNMSRVLKEAGYDSSDVVQCVVYLRDMKDFPKMNLIYGGFFPEGKYPARTTVEVSNLPKNARVEIAATAIR
jgi:2-iminobutanoate/2-iminopropanoate deaminase